MHDNALRILAVDDEPLILDIISTFLDEPGFVVDTAASGDSAWACLQNTTVPYDLVLLDWQMPELDGIELLKRIKQDPDLKDIAVIMQTALGDQARIAEGLTAGAFYYLVKPFDQMELRAIIEAARHDIVRQRELQERIQRETRALGALQQARFRLRTLEEARELGIFIANACPDPARAVLGLTELLINAVEHGNLELGYADKSELLERHALDEEIARRLCDERYARRWVTMDYRRLPQAIEIDIIDEGRGFAWERYLGFEPERAFDTHGRGIAMAGLLSFDKLEYRGRGNAVRVTLNLQPALAAVHAA